MKKSYKNRFWTFVALFWKFVVKSFCFIYLPLCYTNCYPMKTTLIATLALASLTITPVAARQGRMSSPDGSICVTVTADGDTPTFTVGLDGRTIIEPSRFALDIAGLKPATRIRSVGTRMGVVEHIDAPFYRQRRFDINYNAMHVKFDNGVEVEWRVFNDGVAYRYVTSVRDTAMIVNGETASFDFAGDPTVYLSYSTNDANPMAMAYQNYYDVKPLSHASDKLAFLPATAGVGDGVKVTILESDLKSYPGMYLKADTVGGTLDAMFAPYPKSFDYYPWRRQMYVTDTENYIARTQGKRAFPWRIMAITRRDTEMPVNNLVYALAEPSQVDDTGWIRPGKVAWDWWNDWGLKGVPFEAGINTETYKHYIDFAAANGIEYVVLDEGWYNPASGDMLTVIDDIDLPSLVAYGRDRGVGIVLWTVFNVLDDQLEEACRRYADMGIKGFKVDFLDRDDQTAVEMTYRIARACADHGLFLDYHGIYKPTGLSRTYPNVLNYEGVFGMEEVKWTDTTTDFPRYDVTFPYIRLMAGQVDYTPGAMRNSTRKNWRAHYSHPMSMGTRAHQLSCYIIHDSPFTMLCDAPSNYVGEEECVGFITSLPVIFDETRVIDGRLGEYIVTARRADGCWYVAGATDWNERDITVDFSFLPENHVYKATVIRDGVNAARNAEDYALVTDTVDRSTRMPLHLAPGGGFAMSLRPVVAAHAEVTAIPADKKTVVDPFYKKYAESDGLYVTASGNVADEAVALAADIISGMLAKRPDIKRHMVSRGAHVLIIGRDEMTCDIPEYHGVCTDDPDSIAYINRRARGFGGAPEDDLSSGCGEENLLALPGDRYDGENILVHEFAHLIHMLGIAECEPDFDSRLEALWQSARDKGLWHDTYALSCKEEYFAECVQSFFNCNRYSAEPNGVHNSVNRRAKLRAYDPDMYDLLTEYFYETDLPIKNRIHP